MAVIIFSTIDIVITIIFINVLRKNGGMVFSWIYNHGGCFTISVYKIFTTAIPLYAIGKKKKAGHVVAAAVIVAIGLNYIIFFLFPYLKGRGYF